MPDVGDKVKAVKTIHRTSGSAWVGEEGMVVGKTGDGLRIDFGGSFIADNVKDDEVTTI